MTPAVFTIVGENIHTGREVRRDGPSIKTLKDGREAVVFPFSGNKLKGLPIPDRIRSSDRYRKGYVPNVTVGIELGLKGSDAERKAAAQYLQWLAGRQIEHGAHFVNVFVDGYGDTVEDRIAAMRWLVPALQDRCDCPLSVSSEDPRVLLAGLEVYDAMKAGRPMLYAASIDRPAVFQLAAKYRAHTVVRATGRDPLRRIKTADARLENAEAGVRMAHEAGIPHPDIHIDPVVSSGERGSKGCRPVLDAIRAIRRRWPHAHITGNHARVSDKLPLRSTLNLVWLDLAIDAGCDAGFLDPAACHPNGVRRLDPDHPAVQMARAGFLGEDPYFGAFVAAHRAKEISDPLARGND